MALDQTKGFTLVELLVALAVLAIGLVSLFKLQSTVSRYSHISKQQAAATQLAEQKIESLRHYVKVDQTANVKDYTDIVNGKENTTLNHTNYTLTWTVTDNTDPPHKIVNMQVSWTDSTGKAHTLNLSSIIARSEPAEEGQVQEGYTQSLLP